MRKFFRICGLTVINVLFLLCFVPVYANPPSGINPLQNTVYYVAAFLLLFWQPWLLGFVLFGIYGLLMAMWYPQVGVLWFLACLIGSAAVTHEIYRGLHFNDRLDGLIRLGPRRIGAWVGGLLCLGALVSFAAYKDFPVRNRHAPPLRDPGARFTLTNNFLYEDPAPPRLSVRFVWRVHIPRAELPRFVRYLQMRPVDAAALGDTFWDQPPYWWRPPSGTVEIYATPYFSEGSRAYSLNGRSYMDDPYAGAVYEPQSETLYVKGEYVEERPYLYTDSPR